jgi:predicted nucleic acid-binding protein
MAARVLVDAGPIVAYLHRGDAWHKAAVRFFRGWRGELLTTWPVVTEAAYLSETPKARLAIMQWLQRNLQAVSLETADTARIERYYRKYADQNPDLAELSLLAVAERTGVRDILTVDVKDFAVYRLPSGRALNNLLARSR